MAASDVSDADQQREYVASLDEVRDFFAASQHRLLFEQAVEHHHGPALKTCTYSQGYTQQPLFSCLTCRGGTGEEGKGREVALCAACAFKCHSEHELEEIYEKRHTRCDCPTLASRPPILPSAPVSADTSAPPAALPASASPEPPTAPTTCTLDPTNVAYPANAENVYNHNYVGLYCHCNGRYEAGQEVMYQCSLCLDWYHERCMRLEGGQTVPADGEGGLFMCRTCIADDKFDFLLPYLLDARLKRTADSEAAEESGPQTVVGEEAAQVDIFPDVTERQKQQASTAAAAVTTAASVMASSPVDVLPGWQCAHCHYFNQPQQDECFGCEKQKKVEPSTTGTLQTAGSATSTSASPPATSCTRLTHIPASVSRSSPPDLWVQSSWQSTLCSCDDCVTLYRARAPFLLTSDDSDDDEDGEAVADGDEAAEGGEVRSADELMDGYLSSLPRHALLEGMDAMSEWNEAVMRRIQTLAQQVDEQGQPVLITGEMIKVVTSEAKEEVEARRRRRREASEDMEGAGEDESNPSKRGRFEE